MNIPTPSNSNPYIDEVVANTGAYNPIFKKANVDPRPDTIEEAKAASATENAETEAELDLEDLVEGDAELEFEREPKSDDFSSYDPYKDRQRGQNKERQEEKRKQRRIGKTKRSDAPELTQEELFGLLGELDEQFNKAEKLVEDSKTSPDEEFENWNNWFKAEKKTPPVPDSSKVFYIREDYNTKRSPHLWKSNPNKKWVLAFGNDQINNHVAANLYKYQNDTISKDA